MHYGGDVMMSKRHADKLRAVRCTIRGVCTQLDEEFDFALWLDGSRWDEIDIALFVSDMPEKSAVRASTFDRTLSLSVDVLHAPYPHTPHEFRGWLIALVITAGKRRGLPTLLPRKA